jgi:hypothetical protein
MPKVAIAIFLFVAAFSSTQALARSCSDRFHGCVSRCMAEGTGASRKGGAIHPMTQDACQSHCGGWYAGCKQTGCFNGDLLQECGLTKQ